LVEKRNGVKPAGRVSVRVTVPLAGADPTFDASRKISPEEEGVK
jgi:hypothetical protein